MANPLYNAGQTTFSADPYQVIANRDLLKAQGLWNPAWDAWANYQGGGDSTTQGPAAPDLSSLDGYGIGASDFGGGSRQIDLLQGGNVVGSNPYFYDEPSMGNQLAQGLGIVGGSALGLNAAFGGLGGAAASEGIGTLANTLPAVPTAGAAGGAISALPAASVGAGTATAGGLGGLLSSLGSPSGLANLGSAAIGLYGQNKALGAMQDATNQANDFNKYAFDTIRADNKPLVDMRNSVLPQIQGLLSNPSSIQQDPGYQFQFNEGQKALNNSAAGRGMTYSGAQGKALQRYGQDYGATKLDQSLNRLTSVAGLGQVGSNSNNAATQNYGQQGAGNALNMGSARGSAYGGMAQGVNNALLNVFDPWQFKRVNGGG